MKNVNDDLREATENGNEALIKTLLLETQCNPKDADSRGRTALMYAAENGHMSCVQLLLPVSDVLAKDEDGLTALICAAANGNTSCLDLLLLVGDALAKDRDGWSALMCATTYGRSLCVQLLLPVSDCSARNRQGKTASDIALVYGYPELGRLIDAYALSVAERTLLDSSTASATARKPHSLRV